MCHQAIVYHKEESLYITLEMAEERIAERIVAVNISIPDLHDLPKEMFDDEITVTKKAKGKLILKEYPATPLVVMGN